MKVLVAYDSDSGNTEKVAKAIYAVAPRIAPNACYLK